MNDSVIEAAPWSRRRWLATILLLFISQTSLLVLLTDFPSSSPGGVTGKPRIRMVSGFQYESLRDVNFVSDPTLFALVHPKGFSGSAWLRPTEFPYRPTHPLAPPQWLAAESESLVRPFARFMEAKLTQAESVPMKPAPPITEFEVSIGPLAFLLDLRLEGSLAHRRLLTKPALPAADSERILTPCVIEVVVASNGDVLSARRVSSSGSAKTDQGALEFAKSVRFESVAPEGAVAAAVSSSPSFGRLIFRWLPVLPQTGQLLP
ncbi:MAG: TonB family protein [Verrucomicrobia bacterium]|nr:TonB family protein [Verrucomicrobiota bacterium]